MALPVPAITFRVNPSSLMETIGPLTNEKTVFVLPADAYQSDWTSDERLEVMWAQLLTRSTWLPNNLRDNLEKHALDEFTLYGQEAVYMRNLYGIGYAPSGRAVLTIVSEV